MEDDSSLVVAPVSKHRPLHAIKVENNIPNFESVSIMEGFEEMTTFPNEGNMIFENEQTNRLALACNVPKVSAVEVISHYDKTAINNDVHKTTQHFKDVLSQENDETWPILKSNQITNTLTDIDYDQSGWQEVEIDESILKDDSEVVSPIDKSFEDNFSNQHQTTHFRPKNIRCRHCDARFSFENGLNRHMRIVHFGNKPFKCDICDKRFKNKGQMMVHMRLHPGEKPFSCEICQKQFSQRSNLYAHIQKHADVEKTKRKNILLSEKKNTLLILGEKYTGSGFEMAHEEALDFSNSAKHENSIEQIQSSDFVENSNKTVETTNSDNDTEAEEQQLLNSNKTNHLEDSFTDDLDETTHQSSNSGSLISQYAVKLDYGERPRPWMCLLCSSTLPCPSKVKAHFRKHTGEKPYSCGMCRKSFSQKSNLNSHVKKIHYSEKSFVCDICDERFLHKNELNRHLRLHYGPKCHKCELCPSKFANRSKLASHMRIHTGEKPYTCEICQRKFSQKSNLKTHIRKRHK